MINTNPEAYRQAAQHIKSGAWHIDVDNGKIIGEQGRPLTRRSPDGYIHPKFRTASVPSKVVAVFAHRVIWEHVHGPIAPGLTINHRNGIKDDNRISNLEAVSVRDNIRHAVATGLRPGRKGTMAANAKLTDAQVRDIRERCARDRVCDIARDYGVSQWTISSIKHRRTWTHVLDNVA